MSPILKDTTTGETYRIHICNKCDSDIYPTGKPIDPNDWKAKKDEKTGEWICGDCQVEELNKKKIKVLGPNHPNSKFIIELEDKNVKAYNNYAKRWNEMVGAGLKYRKNKYTGGIPF